METISLVKKFDYVSLRDKKSFDSIFKMNSKAKLYPDSVSYLSVVWPNSKLEKKVSKKIKNDLKNIGKYFVIQVKKNRGKYFWKDLTRQIEDIYYKLNLTCVLLPIGYAQGHEDQIILQKIKKQLSTKAILIEENSIFDTAFVISNSCAYIGTSLHGIITSISYSTPHMALTDTIVKQIDFLNTWKTTPIISTNVENLCFNLCKLLNENKTYKVLENSRAEILKEAKNNFDNIYNLITGDKK